LAYKLIAQLGLHDGLKGPQMIKPHEKLKLLPEQFTLRSGLVVPQPFESLGSSEAVLRNELKALQRSNDLLKEQSASLQSRNEELEAYAHTIAHDLKNPLAIIISSCDLIRYIPDLTPQEIKEFIQQVSSTAYEVNNTIDNLLLLSEVRKVDIPVEKLDMAGIVAGIHKRMSSMVKEYQGRIISPKTWPVAIGYAPWIEEVWVNYISNGLKYGGQSPLIELGASTQPDGMIRFWISDSGPGFSNEAQAHLFDPNNQFGQIQKMGQGLGLSIVRRIIEKLGGQVGVESEEGKGSLFYFSLPGSPAMMESIPESKYSM
jgi:two-component system sensor histidine kinase/response regulator